MNRAVPCTRATTTLAAVAILVAGCAGANNTTSSQTSDQGERPYKTMYGLSSEGTTTDLYTEFFGPRQPPSAPATAVAATQPIQPVTAQPIGPPQSATAARPAQAATATAGNRTPQPAATPQSAPVQVAQQPPPEPDVPTAYGITANGPTTDLYTELFGPKH